MTDTTDSSTGPGAGSRPDDGKSPLPDKDLEDKDLEKVSGGIGGYDHTTGGSWLPRPGEGGPDWEWGNTG